MCQKPHRPGVGQISQEFANNADAGRSLPFSGHGIIATTRDDEAADFLSRALVPLRIAKIADRQGFRLDMNGCRLKRLLYQWLKRLTLRKFFPDAGRL
jgi:hypothetical protein